MMGPKSCNSRMVKKITKAHTPLRGRWRWNWGRDDARVAQRFGANSVGLILLISTAFANPSDSISEMEKMLDLMPSRHKKTGTSAQHIWQLLQFVVPISQQLFTRVLCRTKEHIPIHPHHPHSQCPYKRSVSETCSVSFESSLPYWDHHPSTSHPPSTRAPRRAQPTPQ